MQNTSFFLFLSGLIANVTEEQLKTYSDAMKPANPENTALGTLDVEIQKLWVVIQALVNESETETDEAGVDIKLAQAESAKHLFWASARSQFGWDKRLVINRDWQVSNKKLVELCPGCGGDHSTDSNEGRHLIGISIGGLGHGMPIPLDELLRGFRR